jgi:ribonucleoside-diphosphate reductase subunit M2
MKPLSVASVVVDAPTPETAEVEVDSRQRFVGDVNCEEKDEPLLQESTSRFVLFPIKYREVSTVSNFDDTRDANTT